MHNHKLLLLAGAILTTSIWTAKVHAQTAGNFSTLNVSGTATIGYINSGGGEFGGEVLVHDTLFAENGLQLAIQAPGTFFESPHLQFYTSNAYAYQRLLSQIGEDFESGFESWIYTQNDTKGQWRWMEFDQYTDIERLVLSIDRDSLSYFGTSATPIFSVSEQAGVSMNGVRIDTIANPSTHASALSSGAATGSYSTAFSRGTATGDSSIAGGYLASASGANAIAIGKSTFASGANSLALAGGSASGSGVYGSIAIGVGASAPSLGSFAGGPAAWIEGEYSLALGYSSRAWGKYSTAVGPNSVAGYGHNSPAVYLDQGATAIGYGAQAPAISATALGAGTQATGYAATALGAGTIAQGYYQTALGTYNAALGSAAQTTRSLSDVILVVGNGTSSARSNALTIRADAGTAIGTGVSASEPAQIVVGRYNAPATTSVFVVGNGTSGAQSNAFRIRNDGTILIRPSGDLPDTGFHQGEQP